MTANAARDEVPPVPSPCTGVCRIDARTGWCQGCMRSLDEIAHWGSAGEAARRAVWRAIALRRSALPPSATQGLP